MPKPKKELEIESIETPKGSVPTVKGMETALNYIIDQTAPLGNIIQNFSKDISSIKGNLDNISSVIHSFGENFAELVILLSKLDKKITISLDNIKEGKIENIKEQQTTLVELQTILAKLFIQFQQLPLELRVAVD